LQKVLQEASCTEFQRTHKDPDPRFLKIGFVECPIESGLSVLGKKWALLILRDIAAYKRDRFNQLLKSLPGISPRVLATRLKELEGAGLIARAETRKSYPMTVRWALTKKGVDTIPIMMMMTAFESKWYPDLIFEDKQPRKLRDVFTDEALELIRSTLAGP
jgi:DNA-binding HxlR family transcriptional regulator